MREWIAAPAAWPEENLNIPEKEPCAAELCSDAAAEGNTTHGFFRRIGRWFVERRAGRWHAGRWCSERRAEAGENGGSKDSTEGSTESKAFSYDWLAHFLRAVVRPCLRRWDISGAHRAEAPAVYVVHHRNLSGPVHALALLPDTPRPWVLHQFLARKECFAHYYGFTFRKRFGWPHFPAWLTAAALSLVVPPVLRSFGAIPVYRGLRETRGTMDKTVAALMRGESILLCPDIDYGSSDAATGQIYKGFLQLERLYREKTDGHIRFIPVFCGRSKRILTGAPVCFADGTSFRAQRDDIARQLVEALNALAAECGEL